ncbi:MAG: methylated-DNA--[protein]-cysteine S-methyltransferase [Chlorobiaceae bacterium]|nr:methylated-DNA--[protein]-cysteine S-methyltransferase [Chlorobiaceae bacterium]
MKTDNGSTRLCCRDTVIGRIAIAESGGVVTHLHFMDSVVEGITETGSSPLLEAAFRQLNAWLAGELKTFSLPIAPGGAGFVRRVWRALPDIPYGTTVAYTDIASAVGAPGAARAVGSACRRNPLPIIVPCHRVVCRDGRIGDYLGGAEIKRYLIDFERLNGR